MQIQQVPLEEIKPYWRNPRDNADAVEAVKQSIAKYGVNQPLVLDQQHVIIVGHTRYKALQQLGHKTAPCVISDLSARRAREYRIADNKASEFAKWNLDALMAELRDVESVEDMKVFFPEYDLDELLSTTAQASQEMEDVAGRSAAGFEAAAESAEAALVDVLCPHCGEKFGVSKGELLKEGVDGRITP